MLDHTSEHMHSQTPVTFSLSLLNTARAVKASQKSGSLCHHPTKRGKVKEKTRASSLWRPITHPSFPLPSSHRQTRRDSWYNCHKSFVNSGQTPLSHAEGLTWPREGGKGSTRTGKEVQGPERNWEGLSELCKVRWSEVEGNQLNCRRKYAQSKEAKLAMVEKRTVEWFGLIQETDCKKCILLYSMIIVFFISYGSKSYICVSILKKLSH